MNLKNKASQLKAIILVLEEEKNKEKLAIIKLKDMIKKKLDVIDKIRTYRAEYDCSKRVRLSHIVPALLKNMNEFTVKIDDAINKEKQAIEMFEMDIKRHFSYLMIKDQKLKAMKTQLEKIHHSAIIKNENNSQQTDEELTTCRILGGKDE